MPTSPHEFVAVLDDAIAACPKGRRAIALELHAPGGRVALLGHTEHGRYLGQTERGPLYGFTKKQCKRLRKIVLAAAREDAAAKPAERVSDDYYTGEHG